MKKNWQAKNKYADDFLTQLLRLRGLQTEPETKAFLNPEYENVHDPFLLTEMDKAVERIKVALQAKEKITVYADYDADAVTAASVVLRFFDHSGFTHIDYYIPDRFAEGYGMNTEAIERLSRSGTKLLITVDCGTNSVDAIAYAKSLGMEVIVTDHHQITGDLPEALAVINPHRPGDLYPFKDLTGVGVAFKLVQALAQRSPSTSSGRALRGWEKWLLDLVAIGTVADCQSLLGENRIFVKWGLVVLKKTRWAGLKKLFQIAGLEDASLDTYHLGFVIAPRINAAGRIEHANSAVELLTTNDLDKARGLAEKLDALNRKRQELTEQILSEARDQVAGMPERKVLLAAGEGWPKGIVGLVAGKLSEEFSRPVVVLEKGQVEATGSARSIANFNIVEAISKSEKILVKYGGHPMAAGFTLRSEHIEVFHQNLLQYAEEVLNPEDLSPILFYDAEISIDEITNDMVQTLEEFAPFGLGNPRPRFRINSLKPSRVSEIGKEGKHLRLSVESSSGLVNCIGFNKGFWADKIKTDSLIDVICEPQFNVWNGKKTIQLRILDINHTATNESD